MSFALCDLLEEAPRQLFPGITRKERRRGTPALPPSPSLSLQAEGKRDSRRPHHHTTAFGEAPCNRPTHPPFTDTRVRPLMIPHRGFHGSLIVSPILEKSRKLHFDSPREGGASPLELLCYDWFRACPSNRASQPVKKSYQSFLHPETRFSPIQGGRRGGAAGRGRAAFGWIQGIVNLAPFGQSAQRKGGAYSPPPPTKPGYFSNVKPAKTFGHLNVRCQ